MPSQDAGGGVSHAGKHNSLIASGPIFAVLYTLRGDAYYDLNDLQGATKNHTAAIKLDDRQENAYFGRGMALGRMGRVDEVIVDFGRFVQRHPDAQNSCPKEAGPMHRGTKPGHSKGAK